MDALPRSDKFSNRVKLPFEGNMLMSALMMEWLKLFNIYRRWFGHLYTHIRSGHFLSRIDIALAQEKEQRTTWSLFHVFNLIIHLSVYWEELETSILLSSRFLLYFYLIIKLTLKWKEKKNKINHEQHISYGFKYTDFF